ncbi:Multidrug resistance protein stp [Lacunisphaera limnophila]|uniref:Multidrug resistance protein stp n=1 Tax=Lacunisphaera limnophila TaxID=1838286 RepID=A0A1D8ASL6_9BACT|nr:MFS transporter [Lacunisphaera limnophila]AOS43874.1 Multidrug resistance protein stp [Lacunisphaera limnophila]
MNPPGAAGPSRTLALACATVFLVSFDATALVAAFTALRAHFAATTPEALSWILNAYTLVYAALLAPLGGWADRRGRKSAVLLGLTVFTAASVLSGLATSPATLIAGRVLQAVGAAWLTPATLALALDAGPREKRAQAVSLWGASGALAAAVGPALGSWLVDTVSWRAIFWVNVPLGLLLLHLGRRQLPESTVGRSPVRTDWPGAILLSAAGSLLVLGIVRANAVGWLSVPTGASLGAGLLLTLAFVAWARGRPHAAVDLRLFADGNFRLANLGTLLFGACFGMMFLAFYLFMTGVWHYSPSRAGLAAVVGPLVVVPFALLGGNIASRRGYRPVLVAGGLLYAAGQLWYFLRVGAHPAYLAAWLPGQLATGAAIGFVLPGLAGVAVANLPASLLASGNAVNQAIRQLGMALGIAGAVTLAGHSRVQLADFQPIYLLLAGGGLVTALLALPLKVLPGGPARRSLP